MVRTRPVSRRTVLKHGALASAVGVTGVSGVTGTVAAQPCDAVVAADGSGDYTAIQDAIDDASPGATICVRAGTYDEAVAVNEGVTVRGAADPGGPDAAVVDGSVAVSADDATVSRLRVAPTTTFVAGGLDPYGILVSGARRDVTVSGNLVEGMTADSTGGSVTINGIQVWNDGPADQTGTVVRDNVVRDLDNQGDAGAGWPNYGGAAAIKVQGVAADTRVLGNRVEHVHSAGWAYGVVTTHTNNAPGISPTATAVEGNTIIAVNDGSVYDVFDDPGAAPYPGNAFAIDGDALASEATASFNNLLRTPNGALNKDGAHTLVAECNYWGHATGPEADDNARGQGTAAVGDVDYRPWNTRRVDRGERPAASCVGGRRRS